MPEQEKSADEKLAEAYLGMADALAPLHEFLVGQRRQFEEEGFSPTASEQMALQMAPYMLALLMTPKKPTA